MKNSIYSIFIFIFIFISSLTAQENTNAFNLLIRPGIGFNKLISQNDGINPNIPTNSTVGLNLSFGTLIEYSRFSRFKISTGVVLKFAKLHTNISNIITFETINNGWNPIKISETYSTSYIAIPVLFHYYLNDYLNIGLGISYDYLFSTKTNKMVINNTDPGIEKIGNKFYPENYSIIIFHKYSINKYFSILPTVSINPSKTASRINSNSTGPSVCGDFQLELKI